VDTPHTYPEHLTRASISQRSAQVQTNTPVQAKTKPAQVKANKTASMTSSKNQNKLLPKDEAEDLDGEKLATNGSIC